MDVLESYSPERVAREAETMGVRAGWSMDMATQYNTQDAKSLMEFATSRFLKLA